MRRHRVLIVTLPPYAGGVPAKTKLLVEALRRRGHEVFVGYYATLSHEPALVAPSWRLATGARPAAAARSCFDGVPAAAVGTWLPELEFTYYRPSRLWREVIDRYDRHIATGGTVLVSNPLCAVGVPHLVWCASTMIEDRQDRRRAMAWPRRTFDRLVVGPVQSAMERRILRGQGRLMVTSQHTLRHFTRMGRSASTMDLLPVPVDSQRFRPEVEGPAGVLGFAGRLTDPRKNVPLLLAAFAKARAHNPALRLRLAGDPGEALPALSARLGVAEAIDFLGILPESELPDFYRSLDVFVIPSRQEGFGIVGVEAMACGVPVVSTRCGGPEDFVADGETGFLVEHDADEIAQQVLQIVGDRTLRARLSQAARTAAASDLSLERFERTLSDASRAVWGEAL